MKTRRSFLTLVAALAFPFASTLEGSAAAAQESGQEASQEAAEEEFASPELLVSTDWLLDHLDDDQVRLIDARDSEAYARGHLPGAISIPRGATFALEGPRGMVAPLERLAELLGSKGIDDKVRVVVYDEGKNHAAARVFWTLEYCGHTGASVLDGGYTKWKSEGHMTLTSTPEVDAAVFTVSEAAGKLSTKEQMVAQVGDDSVVMLDTRSVREFNGGRVPGAVHIEWTRNFTSDDVPVFLSPSELRKMYEAAGITKDHRVHAY